MKITLITLFFLSCSSMLFSQKTGKLEFNLLVGTKLFTDDYEGPNLSEAWQLKSGLITGLEIRHRKFSNLSIQYFHDEHFLIYAFNQDSLSPRTNLFNRTAGNYLGIQFRSHKLTYGIGHYGSFHQNIIDFDFPSIANNNNFKKHAAITFGARLGRSDIEFVKLIQYRGLFSVFHIDDQFLSIKYHLISKHNDRKTIIVPNLKILIGARSFLVNNTVYNGEINNKIGISFAIGVEYLIAKINTSLYLERDWWLKLNGGSSTRDISGYMSNSIIGLKYHIPTLKNLYLNFGYDLITDNNTLLATWDKINNGLARKDLYYYNVKGICLGIGIPIGKNLNLDVRGFIPTQGEYKFNRMRQSIGIQYNIL